ncbi:MAG TPA: hypothetical protein VGH40_17755 [Roseiarcus sp.]|jgi:flagellar motility protein MotE (MotC chaperone)
MPLLVNRFVAIAAIIALAGISASGALAQNDAKAKSATSAPAAGSVDGVSRYCANVAPVAAEARIAWQTKRMSELEAQLKQRVDELDAKEAEARDWVAKRETMMNTATDDVVAIYAKMDPQAAAAQMATMDESMAAAVLGKLKPNVAGAILDEMDPDKAGHLTGIMSGAVSPTLSPTDEKKS